MEGCTAVRLLLLALSSAALAPPATPSATSTIAVNARFTASSSGGSSSSSSEADPAQGRILVQKFQAYNAGCVLLGRVARDAHLLVGAGASMLRVDTGLGWEPPHMPGVFGSAVRLLPPPPPHQHPDGAMTRGGVVSVDMAPILNYTALLAEQGVRPLFAWSYTPTVMQPYKGSWTSGPQNLSQWRELHRLLAFGLKGTGAEHEVYNEPDLGWALMAPWQRYLDMYKAAALGLRDGDTNATVVGPAMALYPTGSGKEREKLAQFLGFVRDENLPLDALSIHAYGAANWRHHLEVARQALVRANMSHIPIRLTEINTVDTSSSHAQQKRELNNFTIASEIMSMIEELLGYPELEQVYWAQFLEPGANVTKWGGPWGSVDMHGTVKASYNAFAIFHRMPAMAAAHIELRSPGIRALASNNSSRVSLVVWSVVDAAVSLRTTLSGIPFPTGILSTYRIDATHCSFGNSNDRALAALRPAVAPQAVAIGPPNASLSWRGQLSGRAVLYLEVNKRLRA
eukprot:COSAG01_NODE_1199_length_11292_cov_69.798267_6_plen_513_part_00